VCPTAIPRLAHSSRSILSTPTAICEMTRSLLAASRSSESIRSVSIVSRPSVAPNWAINRSLSMGQSPCQVHASGTDTPPGSLRVTTIRAIGLERIPVSLKAVLRVVIALSLFLTACSPTTAVVNPPEAPLFTPRTPTTATPERAEPVVSVPETTPVEDPVWTVAKVTDDKEVGIYPRPRTQTPIRAIPGTTILGTPTTFLVIGGSGDWYEVLVPGRPNGAIGWVRAQDVETFEVDVEVIVRLSDHSLEVRDSGGRTVFMTEVAVGSQASPTPQGTYFVTDSVALSNPGGPWGPYAFGLSARSGTITEFNGGDGIIGIHGTNSPSSIGRDASLGCIRLTNDAISALWELLDVGTPVTITT